jgi:Icc protein
LFEDPLGRLMGVTTQATLEQVLALLRSGPHWPPDLILATGDLVHDYSPIAYRRLQGMLAALEVPVYCLPGNHDLPELLAAYLDTGWVHTQPALVQGGWALVFLDTSRAGSAIGHLSEAELAHAAATLERYRALPTLVCLHHNPIPMGSAWMDSMQVDNGSDLLAILDRHPQVRGILWGHVHQEYAAERKGVKLLAAPSTCVQFVPQNDAFGVDAVPPGYRWLELAADGSIRSGVERLAACPEGLDLSLEGY